MTEFLTRHNGGSPSYSVNDKVIELKNLAEFNGIMKIADGKVVGICYHNGCRTAEDAWDVMKSQYPNVHMYKVNTLNADDIKNKHADGSSKPYFKFYRNGDLQDEVKYMSKW